VRDQKSYHEICGKYSDNKYDTRVANIINILGHLGIVTYTPQYKHVSAMPNAAITDDIRQYLEEKHVTAQNSIMIMADYAEKKSCLPAHIYSYLSGTQSDIACGICGNCLKGASGRITLHTAAPGGFSQSAGSAYDLLEKIRTADKSIPQVYSGGNTDPARAAKSEKFHKGMWVTVPKYGYCEITDVRKNGRILRIRRSDTLGEVTVSAEENDVKIVK